MAGSKKKSKAVEMKKATKRQKAIQGILLLSSLILLQLACTRTRCNIPAECIIRNNIEVSGRVLYKDEPVTGAKISVYKNVIDMKNDNPVKKAVSDNNGSYSLELLPGRYFFTACKKETDLFSYSGRNPITVGASESCWVGFKTEKAGWITTTDYDDEFSSAISGKVLHNDDPVEDAFVTIFLDDSDDFKGPGYSMTSTGPDGGFFFDYLPESEYYVIARKRHSGEKAGPIYEDDLYAYFPGNPLSAQNGKVFDITLNTVSKIDDERIIRAALPDTGFSGKILDTAGNPVKGLHVFAYTDPVIGHKRPAALSLATKDDGGYVVELKEAGTYYIGARRYHGDSPEPGELFGMYDATDDHSIKVESNKFLQNIDIIVEEIMSQ
jgi:uncharacterized GH25 family protein